MDADVPRRSEDDHTDAGGRGPTGRPDDAPLDALVHDIVEPAVRTVVYGRAHTGLTAEDLQDAELDALCNVIESLRRAQAKPETTVVRDPAAYAAEVAVNSINAMQRVRTPRFHRLAGQIRYVAEHDQRLGCGKAPHFMVGLADWRDAVASDESYASCTGCEPIFADAAAGLTHLADAQKPDHGGIVLGYLNHIGRPVPLKALTRAIYGLLGIQEVQIAVASSVDGDDGRDTIEEHRDPAPDLAAQVAVRERLRHAWQEIQQLPNRHAAALLLGMDAEIAVATEVWNTNQPRLAEVMGLPSDRLAAAWASLPWTDARIAELLGESETRIATLRLSARRRLRGRVTRNWPGEAP